jgi:hypothetical protein
MITYKKMIKIGEDLIEERKRKIYFANKAIKNRIEWIIDSKISNYISGLDIMDETIITSTINIGSIRDICITFDDYSSWAGSIPYYLEPEIFNLRNILSIVNELKSEYAKNGFNFGEYKYNSESNIYKADSKENIGFNVTIESIDSIDKYDLDTCLYSFTIEEIDWDFTCNDPSIENDSEE